MKPILALNAFNPNSLAKESGADSLRKRLQAFGAASVLFYEQPLEFLRAEKCTLYDKDGNAYLDFYNNVPSVGHSHPLVADAVARQLRLINTHTRYLHPLVTEYSLRLLSYFPSELSNVSLACSGSESNDLALRQAFSFTGKQGVIVTSAAYHGNTSLVTQVSPSSFLSGAPPDWVRVVEIPRCRNPADTGQRFAENVEAAIADLQKTEFGFAAFLGDSIFSSDGVFADPPGFLRPVCEVAHRAGGLFIADEVQPGFGRTGSAMWGFQRHGVTPDIVTMGKPMGNGFPMSATVTRPEILSRFCETTGYFNTFGGSPAAAAAGSAVLDIIEQERLLENAETVGSYMRDQLRLLAARHDALGKTRGAGLFTGLDIMEGESPSPLRTTMIINGLKQRRVLIGAAGPMGNVLKLRPPLCIEKSEIDLFIKALEETLHSMEAA